ncbi:aldehyde dehydrogenase family 16 member A1-like isoform X2 [Hetaerina americana]
MESLVRGVQARDPRECDVPNLIRTFYHHAGWTQLVALEFEAWQARGVVLGITSHLTPLKALGWLVAPALASGCTVVLKPSRQAAPVALLLAEICLDAGLPLGVLNVVVGGSKVAQSLVAHPLVDKVVFLGTTAIGRCVRQETAGTGKSLTLVMSSRTPMIVLESADLDSACEALIESAWYNQGQVPWAVTDVYVQQSVFKVFSEKLKMQMNRLRVGHNFDKMADTGYTCDVVTSEAVRDLVSNRRSSGSEVLTILHAAVPSSCRYLVPAVVVNATNESNVLLDDDWPMPVVMLNPFRTAKEVTSLANNSKYSLASSIWTQDFSLAEEIAQNLKVGTVWINCVNKFDAGVPFGASRQSGVGRIGGREGMLEYLVLKSHGASRGQVEGVAPSTRALPLAEGGSSGGQATRGMVDRTYKLYYGGANKRPDGNSTIIVGDHQGQPYALVPDGNRKDIRNAVEAAHKAQPGWSRSGAHFRAQVLFYFAENLDLRKEEFSKELTRLVGLSEKAAIKELNQCVECLFFWASVCDKCPIPQCQLPPLVESKVSVSISYDPRGVIGVLSPASCTSPLLTPLSIIAPAIALGNAVVVVPDMGCPLPMFWLCQVADTSDLPAGVINVISGASDSLGAILANHHDVDSLWCSDTKDLMQVFESSSCWSMKQVWRVAEDWSQSKAYHTEFFLNSTLSKAIWKPVGGIFGN